ncbi:Hypothetical protein PHPALM_1899 [Phytophthora palmivora]|uniref:Uncharacterized protein n=1 Tax=Phytophthora palmivora TaxID=4796 RepID=A0A2P4YR40_9STRA|nr:Hypothetical protein PHPALM_1899 [Phytophthora palmivora]
MENVRRDTALRFTYEAVAKSDDGGEEAERPATRISTPMTSAESSTRNVVDPQEKWQASKDGDDAMKKVLLSGEGGEAMEELSLSEEGATRKTDAATKKSEVAAMLELGTELTDNVVAELGSMAKVATRGEASACSTGR